MSSVGGKCSPPSLPCLVLHFLSAPPLLKSKNKQQKKKQKRIRTLLLLFSDLHASPPVSAGPEEAKPQRADAAAAAATTKRECQAQAVSMETSSQSGKKTSHNPAHAPPAPSPPPPPTTTAATPLLPPVPLLSLVTEVPAKDTISAVVEDDKDRIVVEIMQMYGRQQEKLNSTLHKQLQLELVSCFFLFGRSRERRTIKVVVCPKDAAVLVSSNSPWQRPCSWSLHPDVLQHLHIFKIYSIR